MLKLSAEIAEKYPHGAIVGIRVNEVQCGVVCAKTDDADELVGLLHAATDMFDACYTCERAITLLVEAEERTSTDWLNVRAARHIARKAIAKAEGAT